MTTKPRIGFIGLGLMGQAFTLRLTDCGYTVTGYDLDPEKVAVAGKHGVRPAASPAAVATASDIVMVCVLTTESVESVLFGPDGVKAGETSGKLLVDFGTTVVESTHLFARWLRDEAGMGMIDAPVSGGPPAAAAGRLTVMAGGEDADIERVRPVMADLAGTFTHMGGVGAGQVTKLINQVLCLTNYAVIAEALKLAEAGGIDAAKVPQALAGGYADSNLLQAMYPRMLARDWKPAGRAKQILKDLDMVHDFAKRFGAPTPMAGQAMALYRLLVSRGYGELDGVSIFKLYDDEPL